MSWVSLGFEQTFNNIMYYAQKNSNSVSVGATIATIPVEILTAAENLARLPVQVVGAVVKYPVGVLGFTATVLCCGRNCLGDGLLDLYRSLPGLTDILITAYKVVAFVAGTLITATIGLLSARANYNIHNGLGLINTEMVDPEIRGHQNAQLASTNTSLQTTNTSLQRTNGDLQNNNRMLNAQLQQVRAELQRKNSEILLVVDQKKSNESELRQIAELQQSIRSLQSTNAALQERLRTADQSGRIAELQGALGREQNSKTALERNNQQLQTANREINAELQKLRTTKPTEPPMSDQAFFERLQKTQQFHDLLDKLLGNNKELDEWRKASKELEALRQKLETNGFTAKDVPALMSCLEEHKRQCLNLQGQLHKANEDLGKQKETFERMQSEKSRELDGLKAKLTEISSRQEEFGKHIGLKAKENEELVAQLRNARSQTEAASREALGLRDELSRVKLAQTGDSSKLTTENQRMAKELELIKQRLSTLASRAQAMITKISPESLAADLARTFDSSKPLPEQIEFVDKMLTDLTGIISGNASGDRSQQLLIEEIRQKLEELQITLSEKEDAISRLSEEKAKAERQLSELQRTLADAPASTDVGVNDSAARQLVQVRLRMATLEQELRTLRSENSELTIANSKFHSQIEDLKQKSERFHKAQEQLATLQQERESLKGELEAWEPKVRRTVAAEEKAQSLQNQLLKLTEERNAVLQVADERDATIRRYSDKIANLERRNSTLESEISTLTGEIKTLRQQELVETY